MVYFLRLLRCRDSSVGLECLIVDQEVTGSTPVLGAVFNGASVAPMVFDGFMKV